jgi:hypothetical protein
MWVALLALSLCATAAIKTYEVVPCSNFVAVETLGDRGVTQYFRNTVDSRMVAGSWLLVEGSVGDAVGPEACADGAAA